MVLIVVFVHAVAADQVQVRVTAVQFLTDRGDVPCVIVVVNGISFLLADYAAVDKVPFPGQSDLN